MWLAQVSRMLELDRFGKGFLAFRTGCGDSVKQRMFHLTSYLIGKGSRHFMDVNRNYMVVWNPEWGLQVGYPVDNKHLTCAFDPAQEFDTLANVYKGKKEEGWFVRKYSNALILVNPEIDASYTVTLSAVDPSRAYFVATPPEPDKVKPPFLVIPRGIPRLQTITYTPAPATLTLGPLEGRILIADTNYKNPDTLYQPDGVEKGAVNVSGKAFSLDAFPNPFTSVITFRTAGPAARLTVYSIAGRLVADLTNARQGQAAVWNAKGFPAGIYIVKLEGKGMSLKKRITLLK
jgi:hypothetical protein